MGYHKHPSQSQGSVERGGPGAPGWRKQMATLGALEMSLPQPKAPTEIRHKGVRSLTPQPKQPWSRTQAPGSKDRSCKVEEKEPCCTAPCPVPPILTIVRFGVNGVDPQVLPEKRNRGVLRGPRALPRLPGCHVRPGTGAAKLWGKCGEMVNHPLAPPKSAGKLGRHRNRSRTGQRSPWCESWDAATTGEVPPLGYRGRVVCAPLSILSSSPQSTCSCPKCGARAPGRAVG